MSNKKRQEYMKFALRVPELAVLTDHALEPEETYQDSFNLRYRLGPVYDILRNPDTQTPMAIAVYGDWGVGKTTAMKWLHGLINEWNKSSKTTKQTKIRPVWFYPWKYDKKEDVWRGLIAEVIWNAIDIKTASPETVIEAFKMLGVFVGKSAGDIISSAKMKVPGFELKGKAVEKIVENFKAVSHPEKPFLNPYEDALKSWVIKSLGKNQRMVLFIDDLDRCMPEIALQVLEALKLYLNIKELVFVVGVDKKVIDKLVKEHYTQLGLDEDKSGDYLAKMFQVEVQIEPSEQQINVFLKEQLKKISYWKTPHLKTIERDIFQKIIFKLAKRNPREIKRLINSALMTGSGAVMMTATPKDGGIQFSQGLQLFFIRKILDERYTMGLLIGSERGNKFFREWSQIVFFAKKTDSRFQCTVEVPKNFGEDIAPNADLEEKTGQRLDNTFLSFAPCEYHPLLQNQRYFGLFHLLSDKDLGELMQIQYPNEAFEITAVVGMSKDADIIREVIARQRNKKPGDLNSEDYEDIKELTLRGLEISDLELIKKLINLKTLYLSGTQVENLEPIRGLTSLSELYLKGTKVKKKQVEELREVLTNTKIVQ